MFEYGNTGFTRSLNKLISSYPGIFQVRCDVTSRIFFRESENVYQALRDLYDNLKLGICDNEELLADYKEYGSGPFLFERVPIGQEYEDPKARKKKLEELKHFTQETFINLTENLNFHLK